MENNLLFVYGILKRGFDADLLKYKAEFKGEAYIEGATLYRIGRGVGLRLGDSNTSAAYGEVFSVPTDRLWQWLDSIESNGLVYTRKVVPVNLFKDADGKGVAQVLDAWVYEHTYPRMVYDRPIEGGVYTYEF